MYRHNHAHVADPARRAQLDKDAAEVGAEIKRQDAADSMDSRLAELTEDDEEWWDFRRDDKAAEASLGRVAPLGGRRVTPHLRARLALLARGWTWRDYAGRLGCQQPNLITWFMGRKGEWGAAVSLTRARAAEVLGVREEQLQEGGPCPVCGAEMETDE